jgi:hypothetical protein
MMGGKQLWTIRGFRFGVLYWVVGGILLQLREIIKSLLIQGTFRF